MLVLQEIKIQCVYLIAIWFAEYLYSFFQLVGVASNKNNTPRHSSQFTNHFRRKQDRECETEDAELEVGYHLKYRDIPVRPNIDDQNRKFLK